VAAVHEAALRRRSGHAHSSSSSSSSRQRSWRRRPGSLSPTFVDLVQDKAATIPTPMTAMLWGVSKRLACRPPVRLRVCPPTRQLTHVLLKHRGGACLVQDYCCGLADLLGQGSQVGQHIRDHVLWPCFSVQMLQADAPRLPHSELSK